MKNSNTSRVFIKCYAYTHVDIVYVNLDRMTATIHLYPKILSLVPWIKYRKK